MFIRSAFLIALLSVGLIGCQNRGKSLIAPITTASWPKATAHPTSATPADFVPAPKMTASMPTARGVTEQNITPIQELTINAPKMRAPRVAQGDTSSMGRKKYHFGRNVIASRSRARTQKIIIEDDLTRNNYELDSGDRIRLSVFEQRNLSRIYTIDAGGYISVPLIGNVSVRGLTTRAVEEAIADELSQKYIKDPKVSVEINTYRPFYILGQIRNSGRFAFVNGMTVRSAVAVAGGYTARANKRKILLTRRLSGKRITTYVQPGYYIRPGDTLEVRERFF